MPLNLAIPRFGRQVSSSKLWVGVYGVYILGEPLPNQGSRTLAAWATTKASKSFILLKTKVTKDATVARWPGLSAVCWWRVASPSRILAQTEQAATTILHNHLDKLVLQELTGSYNI